MKFLVNLCCNKQRLLKQSVLDHIGILCSLLAETDYNWFIKFIRV